ncbi:MAG: DUF2236 domain-containing protein [Rhodospirillales bacterium]|nr:DUF2236 domain-containing protein [Rhodospirillales bacterium]MBO6785536.1 DUF2236 domain-containing protein [Rhodospirillales bacterium]
MPSAYLNGFAEAARADRELAERYVTATRIGDPAADAVMAELAEFDEARVQGWIRAGIEADPSALADAPPATRAFFADIEAAPAWFDEAAVLPGCRAFHRNSEMFIGAFVAAVLVEGFSTLISQSFSITGRVTDQGVRRLKQNNRHLVEIFLPGGLDRHGDGWKLSVRIRLLHARIRQLLTHSAEWDAAAWGTPLSAAHMAFATAAFSGLLLKRAAMLGVSLSDEERDSFMLIWRYAGHLMGVPENLLIQSQADALRLVEIGLLCEPAPTLESVILSNGLINSAPVVAGIGSRKERLSLTGKIYRISRALIGDELADQLNYPPMNTTGTLAAIRLKNGLEKLLHRISPSLGGKRRASQFQTMLSVSLYADEGIRYRLPGELHAERDAEL